MANTAKSDAYKKKSLLKDAQLTKAQTEKLKEWHLMQEMGKALGIEVPKPVADNPLDKRVNTRINRTPGLIVVLSVQRSLYDTPFQFRYEASSILRFNAEMEAKKAARAEGLTVRFVISISNEDGEPAFAVNHAPRPDIQKPCPLVSAQPYHLSIVEKALAQARARV